MSMPTPALEAFLRALAVAAIHPGLHSVLLFDADKDELDVAEVCLRTFLETFLEEPIEAFTLGPYHHEQELWGDGLEGRGFSNGGGLLVTPEGAPLRVVVIRDLSVLGVDAARACIQLMDSPIAHLERHGRQLSFTPRILWLAGCARDAVGEVSAHLLDRFALRLHPPGWCADPRERLRGSLRGVPLKPDPALVHRVKRDVGRVRVCLRAGAEHTPPPAPSVFDCILGAIGTAPSEGSRRQLSLARLAVGLARLEQAQLARRHVVEAVELLGFGAAGAPARPSPARKGAASVLSDGGGVLQDPLEEGGAAAPSGVLGAHDPQEVFERLRRAALGALAEEVNDLYQGAQQVFPVASLPGTSAPEAPIPLDADHVFPEDKAPVRRQYAALRVATSERSRFRGPIIGTRVTDRMDEVALIPTLMAASLYQAFRRQRSTRPEAEGVILLKSDLRAWRRGQTAERLLIVVLDVTACHDSVEALEPFLRRAYVDRAAVRVISVGALGGENELRARAVATRGVLDPDLARALDQAPGQATPLAHGLYLALRAVREHCHHGRGSMNRVEIVVLTDGLGNVPLAASLSGRISGPVAGEGIEDALVVAGELSRLKSTESFLIPAPLVRAPDVLRTLADALGVADPPALQGEAR